MWMWVVLVLLAALAVVVLVRARGRGTSAVSAERLEELDLHLSHEARVAIGGAIARGKRVLAIKIYRESTGADLATSKAAVDRWYDGIHG